MWQANDEKKVSDVDSKVKFYLDNSERKLYIWIGIDEPSSKQIEYFMENRDEYVNKIKEKHNDHYNQIDNVAMIIPRPSEITNFQLLYADDINPKFNLT